MTGDNPKLDHVNVDVHTKFVQILSICSRAIERKQNSDVNQGPNSVKILRKITGNNPKLDLVNVDVHTKFGQILSIRSQDIERKQISGVNHGGHNSFKILRKIMGNNPKLDHVNVDVHTKFGQILSIRSRAIERKQNSDVNQEP